MVISFRQLVLKQNPKPPARLLALDPGGTTGWSFWVNAELQQLGQVVGDGPHINSLLGRLKPTEVVMERYIIYPWKLKQHSLSDVPTLQLIGQIKLLCDMRKIPYVEQTAQQAKGFATDDKLRSWALFFEDQRHANDSVRHGVVRLLFPKSDVKSKAKGRSRSY